MGGVTTTPTAPSVDALELTRERKQRPVNEFLEQRHPLGSVPGWKACFGARFADYLVAVVVVGRPVARMADDGTELSITRYCRRDDRPANTGSWLISRAKDWVRLEGYDALSAHAGVAGNYGHVYEAVGFLLDCPHCDWVGHSNELVQVAVTDELAERFPTLGDKAFVDACPDCELPPFKPADGRGWTNREGRGSWEDYERRKWVHRFSPTHTL